MTRAADEEGVDFFEFASRIQDVYESLTDTYYNKNSDELCEKARIIILDGKVILKIDDLRLLLFYY